MIISNNLNKLDKELLKKLLFYFQFDELIVLREFNDKFKLAVDEIIEDNVIWFKKKSDQLNFRYLYHTNTLIFNNCLVSTSIANFRFNEDVHTRIKKLLTCNPYLIMNLNFLSLEHLEIVCTNFSKSSDINSIELNAIELKNFKLDLEKKNTIRFYLFCSKLENIYVNGSTDNLTLSNPTELKNLTCVMDSNTNIKKFKNIEQITFIDLNYVNYSGRIFDDLKNLINIFILTANEESINKLRKENNESRTGCKIYFKNCDIDTDLFNYYLFFDLSLATFNHNSLEMLINVQNYLNGFLPQLELHKIDLENTPDEFLKKFIFLNSITLSIDLKFDKFIKILQYYNLSDLKIKISLPIDYLKQIPIYQKRLRKIRITDCNDLSFLLQLKFLNEIKTNKFMDKKIFKELIQNLKYLETIYIGKFFRIETIKIIRFFYSSNLKFEEDKTIFLVATIDLIDNLNRLFSFNIPHQI